MLLHVADLIDVAGDGFRLTSWTEGVEFAPRPGFRPSARAWTEANGDDAWLVLDRDGDGVINDGSEMFGDATPQPQPANGTLRNGSLRSPSTTTATERSTSATPSSRSYVYGRT